MPDDITEVAAESADVSTAEPAAAPASVENPQTHPAVASAKSSIESELDRLDFSVNKSPEQQRATADKLKAEKAVAVVEAKKANIEEGKKSLKISDFSKVIPNAKKLADDLKAPATDDKKKDEVKITDDTLPPEDKKAEEGKPQRDLTGFGEQESKWLQRMPYEAYEYISKELREKKTLAAKLVESEKTYTAELAKAREGKVTLPESYYENPQAGWLQPEVQEAQAGLTLANNIENHWKTQLVNIETGKEWFDLIEDPKTGQIFIDQKGKPAGEVGSAEWAMAKQNVAQYFQQAINQTGRVRGELNSLVTNFQSKHKELIGKVKSAEDQFMPMFKDETSEEFKKVTPIRDELTKFGISKDNPALSMLAKSVALNMILKDMYYAEKAKATTKAAVVDSQRRAGPTQESFNGAAVEQVAQAPKLSDFAKLGLRKINI